jgi:hypothetical protein
MASTTICIDVRKRQEAASKTTMTSLQSGDMLKSICNDATTMSGEAKQSKAGSPDICQDDLTGWVDG